MNMRDWKIYVFTAVVFGLTLAAAQFTAAKIFVLASISGITLLGPAGVLAYAASFTITDFVGEVFGKKAANRLVQFGFVALMWLIAVTIFADILPIAPWQAKQAEFFHHMFGANISITLGGLVAYLISQHHDVWAYHYWKKVTRGKHMWLRNNASTIVSQLIDTTVFITLAFHVFPWLLGGWVAPLSVIASMILGQWIIKIIIALADTPVLYVAVWAYRRGKVYVKTASNDISM